jgi:glycosyltransferase involved in cell wall biosynthesis
MSLYQEGSFSVLPGVTVVVPVHNNADTLAELARRIRATMAGRPLELLYVDDASTDGSAGILRTLDAVVITHARNRGQNAAVLSGLAAARYPLMCVLDADLQDPPEELPRLLGALGPTHVVFSSRTEQHPATSRVFRWILHGLFPTLPPHPCLCFAIDDAARNRLVEAACEGDYLPALIGRLQLSAAQIAIARRPRSSSTGLRGIQRWRYAVQMLGSAMRIRLRRVTNHSSR